MAGKTNKMRYRLSLLGLLCFFLSTALVAGEWTLKPNVGVTETYTNNIELSPQDKSPSLVSQFIIGAEGDFTSKKLQIDFSGTQTYAFYSHDHLLDDDFQTLRLNAGYNLWQENLKAIASTAITNVSRSEAGNSLGDLISGDTVQQQDHHTGLTFDSGNSDYLLSSSLIYSITETEDNIGESKGFSATLFSKNGNAARHVFWDVDGQFSNRENAGFTSKNHQFETKVGAITPYKINPFVRLYNEKVIGTAAGNNPEAIPSWGPGLRYQVAKHFVIDLSYNYVDNDVEASDDYVAADIDWQPSARTSLKAGYSKRFFGDSYELDLSHRTRRLTNTLSYHETIEVFDRNNYAEVSGEIWCSDPFTTSDDCLAFGEVPDDTNGFQSLPVTSLVLEQNNEFSLNKRLAWTSILALSRTTFSLELSARERESLATGIVDDYLTAGISATRRFSSRSDVTLDANYLKNVFDADSPNGPRQQDIYKTFSATYNKSLASSLKAFATLQYIDRQSNLLRYTYTEARASINLTKDF